MTQVSYDGRVKLGKISSFANEPAANIFMRSVLRLLNSIPQQGILKIKSRCSCMAILTRGVKLSELAIMPKDEKKRRLAELVQAVVKPTPEELSAQQDDLAAKIQQFESRYKMSSDLMSQRLASGEIRETADLCSWMMLVRIRGCFEGENRCSQSQLA